jgi:hypothetical protein
MYFITNIKRLTCKLNKTVNTQENNQKYLQKPSNQLWYSSDKKQPITIYDTGWFRSNNRNNLIEVKNEENR